MLKRTGWLGCAALCAALVCSCSGSSSNGSGAPYISQDQFVSQLPAVLCQYFNGCCQAIVGVSSASDCEANVQSSSCRCGAERLPVQRASRRRTDGGVANQPCTTNTSLSDIDNLDQLTDACLADSSSGPPPAPRGGPETCSVDAECRIDGVGGQCYNGVCVSLVLVGIGAACEGEWGTDGSNMSMSPTGNTIPLCDDAEATCPGANAICAPGDTVCIISQRVRCTG